MTDEFCGIGLRNVRVELALGALPFQRYVFAASAFADAARTPAVFSRRSSHILKHFTCRFLPRFAIHAKRDVDYLRVLACEMLKFATEPKAGGSGVL